MKQIIALFFLICFYLTIASAQFEKGCVELSLAGSMGSWTRPASESYTYIFLSTGLDYYIIDGLSLEPEIGFFAVEHNPPFQSVLLNLSYTYRIPNSILAIFVRGGYGFSNSITATPYGDIPILTFDKWKVNLLNIGTGLKILINNNVALRTEINYLQQSYTVDATTFYAPGYTFYTPSKNYKYSNVSLVFGFSILLY